MEQKKIEVTINQRYCKACGICYSLCPKNALAPDSEGKAQFAHPENCIACGLCELRCPDFAIRVEGK